MADDYDGTSRQHPASCANQDLQLIINWSYLRSTRALLLLIGFVLSLIALVLVNSGDSCVNKYVCQVPGYAATYYFFSAVTCVALLSSVFNIGFFAINLNELISDKIVAISPSQWLLIDATHCCTLCISFLMADILMATKTDARPVLRAALILGTLALLVYLTRLHLLAQEIKGPRENNQASKENDCTFGWQAVEEPRLEFLGHRSNIQFGDLHSSSGSDDDDEEEIAHGAWRPLDDNQSTQTFTVDVVPSATTA